VAWLAYTLITVALWTGWSFLGKLALDHTTSVQATLIFGIVTAIVGAVAISIGEKTTSWSPGAIWLAVLSALSGGTGMITFYLALQHGKASAVVPMIGLYPSIVAVLSVLFLGEKLAAVQYVGLLFVATGAVLIGAGG
jgi:bacterial/archaeal transporter family protein